MIFHNNVHQAEIDLSFSNIRIQAKQDLICTLDFIIWLQFSF